MKQIEFQNRILSKLESWSSLGETVNEAGTRLIGHRPEIAPKAYLNIVYPPLDSGELKEFEDRLGVELPEQYKEFLEQVNGLICYSGKIKIMGYIPLNKKFNSHVHNYPSDAYIPNVSARIKGLRPEDVLVAFYKEDGSYVLIDKDEKVLRVNVQRDGGVLAEWNDFDSWLFAEITRYDNAFREQLGTT